MGFQFGNYALDVERRELWRGEDIVHVEPQVFDLLLYLIRNRHRIVSKEDLLGAVWGSRIVSDSTLSNRINTARRAIGDSGEQQLFIRTVARRGLRFVGEVVEAPADARFARPAGGSPDVILSALPAQPATGAALQPRESLPDRPAIAVLPFDNLSGDPEQAFFADGMADEIITALSHCRWLFVIARNSSFTYNGRAVDVRQVGRELGVRYVLEGSIRRSERLLRFNVQLIDATTGAHIWANRFDGELDEVFALQDQITERVVAALEPKLQSAEFARLKRKPVTSLDAYELYLRALQLEYECSAASLGEAIQCLERAIAIDPDYALAHALAAFCYAERAFQAWAQDFEAEAAEGVRLAQRALELDPDDAGVLWMAAFAIWHLGADGARAKELFSRSLAINPNSPMALTMCAWFESGKPESGTAIELIERARRLSPRDPRSWLMSTTMALVNLWARKPQETVAWAKRAVTQNARALPARRLMVMGLMQMGERDQAAQAAKELLALDPQFTLSSFRLRNPSARFDEARFKFMFDALREAGVPE